MKKILVLFLLISNLSFSDEQPRFLEGDDVSGWLDRPDALIDFNQDYMTFPCKDDEVEYEGTLYSSPLSDLLREPLKIALVKKI